MTPFIFWIIIGILLFIGEILSGTFFLLCLAIGTSVVIIINIFREIDVVFFEYIISSMFLWDIVIFAIVSSIFMMFLPKMFNKTKSIQTTYEKNRGNIVEILEEEEIRYIKLDGQRWNIKNDENFRTGDKCTIQEFEGTKVILKKTKVI